MSTCIVCSPFLSGLAAPLVAQKLLGTTGEYAMLFLILMAVMSTGSAEVIAVASIVIYDVYQVGFYFIIFVGNIVIVWGFLRLTSSRSARISRTGSV